MTSVMKKTIKKLFKTNKIFFMTLVIRDNFNHSLVLCDGNRDLVL